MDDAFVQIPIALIACGNKQPHMEYLRNATRNREEWVHWNVVGDLPKDPEGGGVSPHENGTYPVTIIQVFRQEGFPKVVMEICDFATKNFLERGGAGISVACNKGNHRSHVSALKSAQILNTITTPNRQRVFNVQVFALNQGYGKN